MNKTDRFLFQEFCLIYLIKVIYIKNKIVANSKSALKRIAINERNRVRNKSYKSAVKTLMKKYFQAVEAYASAPSDEQLQSVNTAMSVAYSKIDKAVKTGVYHKNNAARKKARLAKALKTVLPQAS